MYKLIKTMMQNLPSDLLIGYLCLIYIYFNVMSIY